MSVKKSILIAMAFIAVFAFVSCDDGSDSGPEGYYVNFTMNGATYHYEKGISDYGDFPFGNITSTSSCVVASPDGPASSPGDYYIIVYFEGTNSGTYASENIVIEIHLFGTSYFCTNETLTVTRFGDIGGAITGRFTGTLNDGFSDFEVSGSFRAKRIDDNTWGPG